MNNQRLDKFISCQLNMTRRNAKNDIRHGFVAVNNKVTADPACIIDADSDKVVYKGKDVGYEEYIYILLNKPSGILSASNDKSRQTVIDLVPPELKRQGLFPVGRLDKDTTGLLIITDDGAFAHDCISPKKNIPKCYIAGLDGAVTDEMCKIFAKGVVLADGTVCKSAILEPIGENSARIVIKEGKYHQIKRMFGAVGLGVNTLHRHSVGNLTLPTHLKSGQCLKMTEEQVKSALSQI